jgi:hypothetical protein
LLVLLTESKNVCLVLQLSRGVSVSRRPDLAFDVLTLAGCLL